MFSQVTPNLSQETRSSQAHSSDSILPGYLISPEVREKLEHHIAQRFMQQQSGLPYRMQALDWIQPQDQFPRPWQVQGKKWPSRTSLGPGKSSQDAQFKCPAKIPPGKDLHQDIHENLGRILKDLYMISANPPVKVSSAKPKLERVEPRQEASRSLRSLYKEEGTGDPRE